MGPAELVVVAIVVGALFDGQRFGPLRPCAASAVELHHSSWPRRDGLGLGSERPLRCCGGVLGMARLALFQTEAAGLGWRRRVSGEIGGLAGSYQPRQVFGVVG